MASDPSQLTVHFQPERRVDVIDVNEHVEAEADGFLEAHARALYCSHHTTAGFLEETICNRLDRHPDQVQEFLAPFRELFPFGASYQHDQLHLRRELSPEQRQTEPRNADSHLTFIGSGLENCVTYPSDPSRPVFFVDLDGINKDNQDRRERRTTIIGFDDERAVEETEMVVPVSNHRIDSVSLRDPRLGIFDQLHEMLADRGITTGRVTIELPPDEHHAGLTVNEYETLLMKYDLAEVLRDPLRFMARKGRNMISDPGAIPDKAKNYAKYDLVRLVNKVVDTLGLSESLVERIIDKCLAVPAERFLRMKRSVSLLVTEDEANVEGTIVQGRYQSPILVQWRKSSSQKRRLRVRFTRFE
ncbi:MAG: hypothetical protein BRD55_12205 [Bacteroidetes bacterium SW_9_63_38]|nr:MAG: hypothetical protein BRD55_12205 [Bacteroidetes bacterium SW_9_63_38]